MEAQSRLDSILSLLMIANSTTIKDLTRKFKVSEMTIRRDIDQLEKAGMVRSYRGGVIVAERHARASRSSSYSLPSAETVHEKEKRAIAKIAASLIQPGDVVFFDSGSTIGFILDYVDPQMEMTVLCYSLNIFNLAAGRKRTQVIFSGGVYHPDSTCCDSPEGLALINRKRTSKAFISANGLHRDLGVTTPGQYDIPIKSAAMANSAHSYLVADSSKCGLVRTGHFADLEDFQTLISDSGFPQDLREYLAEKGVELLTAEAGPEAVRS